MSITDQKLLAMHALDCAESFDPTCIVAGGAPRDWYFGNMAKDIDLFVHLRPGLGSQYIVKMLNRSGLRVKKFMDSQDLPKGYRINPHITCVADVAVGDECCPVQVIVYDKPTWNITEEFPVSISQIWFKGDKTGYDRVFENTVKNKLIIKTNEVYANGHAYIQKIRGKFPDFKYYDSWGDYGKAVALGGW